MRTNRKDFIPNSPYRKYREINNPDGTKSFEDVTTYSQTGDVVAAADLNELSQNAVWPLSYSKSGNVHSLSGMTGASGMVSIVFRAGDRFNVGDKFAIDGVAYQPRLNNGELPETNTFALGTTVSAIADTVRRTINFKSAGGGIKLPANALVHIARYTADGTFVVPMDGKYRITVVGHGGKGADTSKYQSYAAGGGAGGACMAEKYLKKGQTYTITVNAGQSSFGNLLTATAGQDAADDNAPGVGGTASGGDINYTGRNGKEGDSELITDAWNGGEGGAYSEEQAKTIPILPTFGGRGGIPADRTPYGIRNGKTLSAGVYAVGAGGGGAAKFDTLTGTGAPGSSGAVIVEYIVPNPSILTARGDHIEISGSANAPFVGFSLYGKTMQKGVPTPEKPVPLNNVGDKGNVSLTVSRQNVFESGLKYSTVSRKYQPIIEAEETAVADFSNGESYDYFFWIDASGDGVGYYDEGSGLFWNAQFSIKKGLHAYFRQSTARTFNPGKPIISLMSMNSGTARGVSMMAFKTSDVQSVSLSTPNGLPGIPVPSGGNYTDSTGQQWICDEMDLERGVYIKRTELVSGFAMTPDFPDFKNRVFQAKTPLAQYGAEGITTVTNNRVSSMDDTLHWTPYPGGINVFAPAGTDAKSISALISIPASREIPLSPEELSAYKALHTNYPSTTIFNDENAWMSVSCQIKE